MLEYLTLTPKFSGIHQRRAVDGEEGLLTAFLCKVLLPCEMHEHSSIHAQKRMGCQCLWVSHGRGTFQRGSSSSLSHVPNAYPSCQSIAPLRCASGHPPSKEFSQKRERGRQLTCLQASCRASTMKRQSACLFSALSYSVWWGLSWLNPPGQQGHKQVAKWRRAGEEEEAGGWNTQEPRPDLQYSAKQAANFLLFSKEGPDT